MLKNIKECGIVFKATPHITRFIDKGNFTNKPSNMSKSEQH